MKYKRINSTLLFVLLFWLSSLHAQDLVIKKNTGEENIYALNDVKRITFETGKLAVLLTDGSKSQLNQANMQYLAYKNLVTSVNTEEKAENESLLIFPNPAKEELYISYPLLVGRSLAVEIVSITGKVVYRQAVDIPEGKNHFVDISTFPNGIYLYRSYHENTVLTAKFIKR
jgi:hypothetical protein